MSGSRHNIPTTYFFPSWNVVECRISLALDSSAELGSTFFKAPKVSISYQSLTSRARVESSSLLASKQEADKFGVEGKGPLRTHPIGSRTATGDDLTVLHTKYSTGRMASYASCPSIILTLE